MGGHGSLLQAAKAARTTIEPSRNPCARAMRAPRLLDPNLEADTDPEVIDVGVVVDAREERPRLQVDLARNAVADAEAERDRRRARAAARALVDADARDGAEP